MKRNGFFLRVKEFAESDLFSCDCRTLHEGHKIHRKPSRDTIRSSFYQQSNAVTEKRTSEASHLFFSYSKLQLQAIRVTMLPRDASLEIQIKRKHENEVYFI